MKKLIAGLRPNVNMFFCSAELDPHLTHCLFIQIFTCCVNCFRFQFACMGLIYIINDSNIIYTIVGLNHKDS